jgi:hypothetical protein
MYRKGKQSSQNDVEYFLDLLVMKSGKEITYLDYYQCKNRSTMERNAISAAIKCFPCGMLKI